MSLELKKINYSHLNARQKENYNFQKISAILADYGFVTIRLTDDWNGADFLALHIEGETRKVQLKGRLTFCKRYEGKGLWVAFPADGSWYLYPHDELQRIVFKDRTIAESRSWQTDSIYSFGRIGKRLAEQLDKFLLR